MTAGGGGDRVRRRTVDERAEAAVGCPRLLQKAQDRLHQQFPLPSVSGMRVSIVDDRLEISATLADAEGVEKLIAALNANKILLPKRASPHEHDENTPAEQAALALNVEEKPAA